jgi:hypothetical protein
LQRWIRVDGGLGAFGAGLLVGWTERSDRPQFDYLTGVSTGALNAPFAFQGSAYDQRLQELYTSFDEDSLVRKRLPPPALTEDAVYDTTPLFEKILAVIDQNMLEKIGPVSSWPVVPHRDDEPRRGT